MRHITCSLKPSFAHENCLIFAGIGSSLHCYQFLIYTLCLRINFHTWSFWVLILAAGGPYWVLISQKNGSLLGPYLKAWGSLLVLETVLISFPLPPRYLCHSCLSPMSSPVTAVNLVTTVTPVAFVTPFIPLT